MGKDKLSKSMMPKSCDLKHSKLRETRMSITSIMQDGMRDMMNGSLNRILSVMLRRKQFQVQLPARESLCQSDQELQSILEAQAFQRMI